MSNSNDLLVKMLSEGSISIPKQLITMYSKLGLKEEEMMLLIHILTFIGEGVPFPTPQQLSERMSISAQQAAGTLRSVMQKGCLSIEERIDEQSIRSESYTIKPLWERLSYLLLEQESYQENQRKQDQELNLYTMFEKEFGRPLSPIECETLGIWVDQDQHHPLLIKAALREAVISGKLNLRYIDRILLEWKKNKIQTIDQAREYGKQFRKQQPKPKEQENHNQTPVSAPFYNWLEQ